jgi:hypothetical protein
LTGTLRFYGGHNSISGIGPHWRIFHHSHLHTITIENNVDVAEDWSLIPELDSEHPVRSALGVMHLHGIDIKTARRLLVLPMALKELTLHFNVYSTRSLISEFMESSTDELLTEAFGPLFSRLEKLDFQHLFLNNFKWGKFQNLMHLSVDHDHLFPGIHRVWGELTLADLIPATLRKLVIRKCRFGAAEGQRPFDNGDDILERSILRLIDEVRLSETHVLKSLFLSVESNSLKGVPASVIDRASAAGMELECLKA